MKKSIAFAFLFAILFCCEVTDDPGGECPPSLPFFDIDGMNVSNLIFNNDCCPEDAPDGITIPFDRHKIGGTFSFSLHAKGPSKGGFLGNAYALSCIAGGHEGSLEEIENIIVTTNYDLFENYLAEDTINDLLIFDNIQSQKPLHEYLSDDKSIPNPRYHMYLTEKPTLTDTVSFNITLILDNGESYSGTTARVVYEQ